MAEDLEHRIRQRAHEIWERDGRPEGRASDHWALAREEIAIEDNQAATLKPNPAGGPEDTAEHTEPVEPVISVINQGEMPGLDDQGSGTPQFPAAAEPLPSPRRRRKPAG
ncbi:DUF2934 domain-containing protein [Azospirillum halopraeferens]|uniref:DUF2934 domain-containing protein n=1 Tax=Azospirillum halopraeferens TaxID=34010 RepID=UPI00040B93BB|nr:DUF2934 domain-containing protein [Azospirillum halopraeferens]